TIKGFDAPEGAEIGENDNFYIGAFNGQSYITVGGKNLSEILEMRSDGIYINGKRFDSDFLKDAKTKDTLTVI
ncbi:hypothetical protein OZK63_42515, partial [Streptomyces sp. UMAF16]|nr:hypothetical protein [Streptomyces sp. UMAF16]